MYLAVLAVFPADLIRIPRCPYGVWPKLFSWSPYWVSGCLCREFRRNWNLLETNTNIHMRRQHTVDDDMKERLNRPKYIDCGPGKCGSTLVIQDGCKKAIMPREKLLGKKKWVEVSSSKKQMLARQSPLNKDNKICNRCYLKEVSLRKSSLRATETPSPFPVVPRPFRRLRRQARRSRNYWERESGRTFFVKKTNACQAITIERRQQDLQSLLYEGTT